MTQRTHCHVHLAVPPPAGAKLLRYAQPIQQDKAASSTRKHTQAKDLAATSFCRGNAPKFRTVKSGSFPRGHFLELQMKEANERSLGKRWMWSSVGTPPREVRYVSGWSAAMAARWSGVRPKTESVSEGLHLLRTQKRLTGSRRKAFCVVADRLDGEGVDGRDEGMEGCGEGGDVAREEGLCVDGDGGDGDLGGPGKLVGGELAEEGGGVGGLRCS